MIGQPHPDFTYGFNLALDYKGIDLSVDMMGVYGNEIYRDWGRFLLSPNSTISQSV